MKFTVSVRPLLFKSYHEKAPGVFLLPLLHLLHFCSPTLIILDYDAAWSYDRASAAAGVHLLGGSRSGQEECERGCVQQD